MVDKLIVPRRVEDWVDSRTKQFTLRALKFFEQLTNTANKSVTDIESAEQFLTSTSSRVSRNASRINSLELDDFVVVETTVGIITNRNQIIICKNITPINITLDPLAVEGDEVHIKRRGAEVTEIGLIDGLTDRTINVLNWSDHLVFDGTDWSVI
jgi:hypothetical protein